jgi:hypothetical protein
MPLPCRSCGFRTPGHYGEDVQQWFNTCPGRWTGRRGLIAWSPWTPDLTAMDFFLRGHVKEHIYAVPPRTIKDLVARLKVAVITVSANMLRCVQENALRHAAVCLEMYGGCFKNLL